MYYQEIGVFLYRVENCITVKFCAGVNCYIIRNFVAAKFVYVPWTWSLWNENLLGSKVEVLIYCENL